MTTQHGLSDESFDTINRQADLTHGKGWERPISNLSDTPFILSICREMKSGAIAERGPSECVDPSSFSPMEPHTTT